MLRGRDVAELPRAPALVFFNACESARIRRRDLSRKRSGELRLTAGVAEALLRGGVAQFVGTYWSVGDEGAARFATTFYRALLAHLPIGTAVDTARRELAKAGLVDWADYLHFGARNFQLKVAPR